MGAVISLIVDRHTRHSLLRHLDEFNPEAKSRPLEKVVFANPHTVLTVRTKDVVYTASWRAAFQLNSMGVKPTDLKVGDAVVISGTPAKDAASHQLARVSEVRRVTDGWTWRLEGGRVRLSASR